MAKISKRTQKKILKNIKNLPTSTKILSLILFIVMLISSLSVTLLIQKNDKFELNGEKVVSLFKGETYLEPSINDAVTCISFGKDISSKVFINEEETTFNKDTSINEVGTYYIVYEVDDFKFTSIQRIRTIVIYEEEVNEDGVGDNNG